MNLPAHPEHEAFDTTTHEVDLDLGRYHHVVHGPITFVAVCNEQVLACFGRAWIGYLTGEAPLQIADLRSKLHRLARVFTLDGGLGSAIANELLEANGVEGTAVQLKAADLCIRIGGFRERDAGPRSLVFRGIYTEQPRLQLEFLRRCGHAGVDPQFE